MSDYNPDRWVMLEIDYGSEKIREVFAGWYGSYTGGESWKLSSGVTETAEDGDYYIFTNYSGSVYRCHKQGKGMSGYMYSVYSKWLEQAAQEGSGISIEIVDLEV